MVRTLPGILIRPAVPGDATELLPRLRPGDLREVAALAEPTAAHLEHGVAVSDPCWAAVLDGRVELLFGVGRAVTGRPTAWLLRSDAVPARAIWRHSRVWLGRMLLEAGQDLVNLVPEGSANERWLRRLGAVFPPSPPLDVAGLRFRLFVLPYASV